MVCRALIVVSAVLAASAAPVRAQARAALQVVVQDTAGRPLAEARVRRLPDSVAMLTDAAGRAVLRDLPADTVRVEVLAIGHEPRVLTGVLRAGVVAEPTVSLMPLPFWLDPLVGTADAPMSARLAGFARRRQLGLGTYLDRAEIASRRAQRAHELLLGITGVSVRGGRVQFQRGGGQIGKMGGECRATVYLDGVFVEGPDTPLVRNGVLDELHPEDLEAIEVYRSVGSAPPEYARMDLSCGLILLWTRVGDA